MSKFWRRFLMKRRRRPSSGTVSKDKSNEETVPLFWRRRRSDTTDETAVSAASDDAPWRVENILLNGAPGESDWWQSDEDDASEENRSTVSSSSSSNNNKAGETPAKKFRNCGLETWLAAQKAWKQGLPAPETLLCEFTESSSSCSANSGSELAAAACSASKEVTLSMAKPASPLLRRELVRNLGDVRHQYTLPRRMALSDMISVYNEIWHGSD